MTKPHPDLLFYQISADDWLSTESALSAPSLTQRLNWLSELGIANLLLIPPRKPNKNFEQWIAFLQSKDFELYKPLAETDYESFLGSESQAEILLAPHSESPTLQAADPLHLQIFPNLLATALETGDASLLEVFFESDLPNLHPVPLLPPSSSHADQKRTALLQSLALSLPGFVLFNDQPEYPLPLAPALEKAFHRVKTMIQIRSHLGCQAQSSCQWINSTTPSVAAILKEGKESKLLVLHNFSANEVDLNLWRTGIAREMLSGKLVDLAGLDRLLGYQVMWLELE